MKRSKTYRRKRAISAALTKLCEFAATRWGVPPPTAETMQVIVAQDFPLISARDAAKQLGVSTKTLANWRCSGVVGLPHIKVGSRIFYRQDHLNAFVRGMTKLSTSDLGGFYD